MARPNDHVRQVVLGRGSLEGLDPVNGDLAVDFIVVQVDPVAAPLLVDEAQGILVHGQALLQKGLQFNDLRVGVHRQAQHLVRPGNLQADVFHRQARGIISYSLGLPLFHDGLLKLGMIGQQGQGRHSKGTTRPTGATRGPTRASTSGRIRLSVLQIQCCKWGNKAVVLTIVMGITYIYVSFPGNCRDLLRKWRSGSGSAVHVTCKGMKLELPLGPPSEGLMLSQTKGLRGKWSAWTRLARRKHASKHGSRIARKK